ncbi:MAG TPA: hypothetical protein P5291_09395, partial [Flavobacteriales bacterium]|nr:hypothetical protein [Flavobacteriales bacterium]
MNTGSPRIAPANEPGVNGDPNVKPRRCMGRRAPAFHPTEASIGGFPFRTGHVNNPLRTDLAKQRPRSVQASADTGCSA